MPNLTDFKLLSFDVYGTLIDWEHGALQAFRPMLQDSQARALNDKHILSVLHKIESDIEASHPDWTYAAVLAAVHPLLCAELGLPAPSAEESRLFGASVGSWPAFSDTVRALRRLQKVFKLVVLSNVDNESFRAGNANGLEGFKFDAVYTAQDIGSYKPALRNFEYMLSHVKEQFGIEKGQVLQTAQSQFHDHHPAREMGMQSAWIYRPGAVMGNREDPVFTWKFDTLADMADAVDKELADDN